MLRSYTHSEMLNLWRARAGLDTRLAGCNIEAVEGFDADSAIAPRMRAWYLRLLDSAPAALLPVEDVSAEIMLVISASGSATASLPVRARRLLELRLASWRNPAVPVVHGEATRRQILALNPYSAPGAVAPMCAVAGRALRLMPAAHADKVARAMAVVDPGPDIYILDESLLNEIPDIFDIS